MIRKLMFVLAALAVIGFAAAQITVDPVEGVGDDAIAKGAKEASVDQLVELKLPKATALHLAATTITFDLAYLDGEEWEDRAFGDEPLADNVYACVYVSGPDYAAGTSDDLWNQPQVVPGGIAYAPIQWDEIKLIYIGNSKSGDVPERERVVTYPPIRIVDGVGLVEGSKDYFVCYQSFVIQLFSNFPAFDLQVERNDTGAQSIEHLYVQGNTCADFGAGTGLYELRDTWKRSLLPKSLTFGPTGTYNGDCNPDSSWMDVLGVLAVKVNADLYGTSTANLTYTLVSSKTEF